MIVSTFGKISSPNPLVNVVYTSILKFIQNPSKRHIRKVVDFRETKNDIIKETLPVVTWPGMFSYRNSQSILKFSNFIYVDFDKINPDEKIESLKTKSFVRAVWKSVSNKGVGCIVECESLDKENYLPTYRQLTAELDGDVDSLPDYTRCNVISYDPDIYVNFSSEIYPAQLKVEREIEIKKYVQSETFSNIQMFQTNGVFENTVDYYLRYAFNAAIKNKGYFFEGNRSNFTISFTGTCKKMGLSEFDVLNFLIQNGLWFEDTQKIITYVYRKY